MSITRPPGLMDKYIHKIKSAHLAYISDPMQIFAMLMELYSSEQRALQAVTPFLFGAQATRVFYLDYDSIEPLIKSGDIVALFETLQQQFKDGDLPLSAELKAMLAAFYKFYDVMLPAPEKDSPLYHCWVRGKNHTIVAHGNRVHADIVNRLVFDTSKKGTDSFKDAYAAMVSIENGISLDQAQFQWMVTKLLDLLCAEEGAEWGQNEVNKLLRLLCVGDDKEWGQTEVPKLPLKLQLPLDGSSFSWKWCADYVIEKLSANKQVLDYSAAVDLLMVILDRLIANNVMLTPEWQIKLVETLFAKVLRNYSLFNLMITLMSSPSTDEAVKNLIVAKVEETFVNDKDSDAVHFYTSFMLALPLTSDDQKRLLINFSRRLLAMYLRDDRSRFLQASHVVEFCQGMSRRAVFPEEIARHYIEVAIDELANNREGFDPPAHFRILELMPVPADLQEKLNQQLPTTICQQRQYVAQAINIYFRMPLLQNVLYAPDQMADAKATIIWYNILLFLQRLSRNLPQLNLSTERYKIFPDGRMFATMPNHYRRDIKTALRNIVVSQQHMHSNIRIYFFDHWLKLSSVEEQTVMFYEIKKWLMDETDSRGDDAEELFRRMFNIDDQRRLDLFNDLLASYSWGETQYRRLLLQFAVTDDDKDKVLEASLNNLQRSASALDFYNLDFIMGNFAQLERHQRVNAWFCDVLATALENTESTKAFLAVTWTLFDKMTLPHVLKNKLANHFIGLLQRREHVNYAQLSRMPLPVTQVKVIFEHLVADVDRITDSAGLFYLLQCFYRLKKDGELPFSLQHAVALLGLINRIAARESCIMNLRYAEYAGLFLNLPPAFRIALMTHAEALLPVGVDMLVVEKLRVSLEVEWSTRKTPLLPEIWCKIHGMAI